jgi:hypothetical protein
MEEWRLENESQEEIKRSQSGLASLSSDISNF